MTQLDSALSVKAQNLSQTPIQTKSNRKIPSKVKGKILEVTHSYTNHNQDLAKKIQERQF
jgi:hypothetical protein